MSEEDHYLRRQDHGRSGNVFAARSEYRGGRRRPRRGRHTPAGGSGGVRGGSGNPQTAARQRDVTEFRDVTPLLATTTAPAIGGGGRPPYRSHSASGSANANNRRDHPYKNFKPITCKRCLSRKGTHTVERCPSTLWCHTCSNASHNSGDCRRGRDNQQ